MSRKDRSTLIALGMSAAMLDISTNPRGGVFAESPDAIEFPGFIPWYERRERERRERDRAVQSHAAMPTRE